MKRFVFFMLLGMISFQSRADIVLSITPSAQSISLGDQVSFNINVNGLGNGTSLGTYDLIFDFDPALLSYSSVTFGNQLDLFGFGDLQSLQLGIGNIELYELSLESVNDLNSLQASSFILATLSFDTLISGIDSPLSLSINSLGDASGNSIVASVQNATVSVTAVPVPAAFFLFASGLSILAVNRRKFEK